MAQVIADRRDVDFVLHEQLQVEGLSRHERYEDFNRETVDQIVTEARNLAIKGILPTQKDGDREGCRFENGAVTVPQSFPGAYQLLREGGWVSMTDDPEWGGQGMPSTVFLASWDYLLGANPPLMMYASLTHGAGKLVERFGTDKQKELFLEKLYSGEWGGTMLLTEPDAGSDVGALTTTAEKRDDGTYFISGNKLFISCGEHDMVDNIVHPVLARITGAPAGTQGISLFLVPKIWVNDDGSLAEANDVVCTGIEEKMGIHGSATCAMTLGDNGQCRGTLLGRENKGMSAMFVMMNEARLGTGMQGFACASASYMNALNYARERIQGKPLGVKDSPSVPIIEHPDVRRMLLTMKAYVEGMRSLLYYIGHCEDRVRVTGNADEKARYQGLIDILIPIAKGYVTDKSYEVCNLGVQIYGGYGYIQEYPQEQLLRDCKITQIYEGTNGIQAMDLLGRKLQLNRGQDFNNLLAEMNKTLRDAKGAKGLSGLAAELSQSIAKLVEAALHMGAHARSAKMLNAFAFAYPFMEVLGDVIMGWMLLWRASVAAQKLESGSDKTDIAFYEGQIKSAQFFIRSNLPVTRGKMEAILSFDGAVMEITESSFGGD